MPAYLNKSKCLLLSTCIIPMMPMVSHAATSVFVLDNTASAFSDGLNNGDSLTSNGVTMTFSNVVVSNGTQFGDVEGTGILISSSTDPSFRDVISFSISFSERVQIMNYDIGAREDVPSGRFFTLSGNNGTSGSNSIPEFSGSTTTEIQLNFDSGTIPFFEANEAYSFTHNLPTTGDPLFNLEQITVETIPEPSSFLLLGLATIGLCFRRSRSAAAQSRSMLHAIIDKTGSC